MRVRTLATIETPRGEVPAGKIIIIPDEVFDRLRGKVETVPVLHSPADTLFRGAVEIITPQGARVWIATTPEAAMLIPHGAVIFQGDEIMKLKKAGTQVAKVALMVKQVFGSDAVILGNQEFPICDTSGPILTGSTQSRGRIE